MGLQKWIMILNLGLLGTIDQALNPNAKPDQHPNTHPHSALLGDHCMTVGSEAVSSLTLTLTLAMVLVLRWPTP